VLVCSPWRGGGPQILPGVSEARTSRLRKNSLAM
jgi:hypothetical protein